MVTTSSARKDVVKLQQSLDQFIISVNAGSSQVGSLQTGDHFARIVFLDLQLKNVDAAAFCDTTSDFDRRCLDGKVSEEEQVTYELLIEAISDDRTASHQLSDMAQFNARCQVRSFLQDLKERAGSKQLVNDESQFHLENFVALLFDPSPLKQDKCDSLAKKVKSSKGSDAQEGILTKSANIIWQTAQNMLSSP